MNEIVDDVSDELRVIARKAEPTILCAAPIFSSHRRFSAAGAQEAAEPTVCHVDHRTDACSGSWLACRLACRGRGDQAHGHERDNRDRTN